MRANVSKAVTAENQFTDALEVNKNERVSVSISSTAVSATISLQRRLDGTNWRTIKTYTANVEETYEADEGCDIRIGVATGSFTSATGLTVRLGKG